MPVNLFPRSRIMKITDSKEENCFFKGYHRSISSANHSLLSATTPAVVPLYHTVILLDNKLVSIAQVCL